MRILQLNIISRLSKTNLFFQYLKIEISQRHTIMDGEAAENSDVRNDENKGAGEQSRAAAEMTKGHSPMLSSDSGRRAEQTSSNKYRYLRKRGTDKGKVGAVQVRAEDVGRKQAANTERRWTQNPLAPGQNVPGTVQQQQRMDNVESASAGQARERLEESAGQPVVGDAEAEARQRQQSMRQQNQAAMEGPGLSEPNRLREKQHAGAAMPGRNQEEAAAGRNKQSQKESGLGPGGNEMLKQSKGQAFDSKDVDAMRPQDSYVQRQSERRNTEGQAKQRAGAQVDGEERQKKQVNEEGCDFDSGEDDEERGPDQQHANNQIASDGLGSLPAQMEHQAESSRVKLDSERLNSGQLDNYGDAGEMGENEDPDRSEGSGSEGRDEDQEDADSDDNNYEVCFVVQDVEFFTFKENFIQQSKQFRDIVDSIDDTQQIRILLPLWSTAQAFRIVLDFVNTNEMFWASGNREQEGKDIYLMQNVLWLADFFQLHKLQKQCIDKHIIPGLSQQNIVTFIKDAYAKLLSSQDQLEQEMAPPEGENGLQTQRDLRESQVQSEDIWYGFFSRCLEICAEKIDYLVSEKEAEMMDLPEAVIDEIFERALRLQQRVYSAEYIKFLLRYKKLMSVFELYDQEKRKTVSNYHNLVRNHIKASGQHLGDSQPQQSIRCTDEQQKANPLLTWRLENLNLRNNFQKDSDPFYHEGIFWKLFIQKLNDKECQIGLKYAQEFNRETQTRDGQVFFDKYSILSVLFWTRLESEPPFGQMIADCPPQVPLESIQSSGQAQVKSMTISATKSQLILRVVPLSRLTLRRSNNPSTGTPDEDACLSIEVYIQLKPILSLILNYMTIHFGTLTVWPSWTSYQTWPIWPDDRAHHRNGERKERDQEGESILPLFRPTSSAQQPMSEETLAHPVQHLTVDELALVLSHRKLGVASEDEVIDCVAVWFGGILFIRRDNGAQNKIQDELEDFKKIVNINRLTDEQILQIVYHINWPYVSFDKLLAVFRAFPMLRRVQLCKSIYNNQILKRVTKKSNIMTSPPRCSYSSVMIETIFDYKFYIDKISEFMMDTFTHEEARLAQMSQLEAEMLKLREENRNLRNQMTIQQAQANPGEGPNAVVSPGAGRSPTTTTPVAGAFGQPGDPAQLHHLKKPVQSNEVIAEHFNPQYYSESTRGLKAPWLGAQADSRRTSTATGGQPRLMNKHPDQYVAAADFERTRGRQSQPDADTSSRQPEFQQQNFGEMMPSTPAQILQSEGVTGNLGPFNAGGNADLSEQLSQYQQKLEDLREMQNKMGNMGIALGPGGVANPSGIDFEQRSIQNIAEQLMTADNVLHMPNAQDAIERRPGGFPNDMQLYHHRQEQPGGVNDLLMPSRNQAQAPHMFQNQGNTSGSSRGYFQAQPQENSFKNQILFDQNAGMANMNIVDQASGHFGQLQMAQNQGHFSLPGQHRPSFEDPSYQRAAQASMMPLQQLEAGQRPALAPQNTSGQIIFAAPNTQQIMRNREAAGPNHHLERADYQHDPRSQANINEGRHQQLESNKTGSYPLSHSSAHSTVTKPGMPGASMNRFLLGDGSQASGGPIRQAMGSGPSSLLQMKKQ